LSVVIIIIIITIIIVMVVVAAVVVFAVNQSQLKLSDTFGVVVIAVIACFPHIS